MGDVVEMLPTSAWAQDLADGLTHQHSRIGAHVGVSNTGGMTTDTLTVTGAATLSGGTTLPAGDIATADIADSAVTTAKVADSAITPAKMLGVDLFGVTGAYVGSVPAAGTGQFYMQAGSSVGTFSLNALDISFPTAFPNGVLTIVVTDGDSTTGAAKSLHLAETSASSFRVQSPTNGTQRINWIAVGF